MRRALGIDGQFRRVQGLGNNLATEHPANAAGFPAAKEMVVPAILHFEQFEQIGHKVFGFARAIHRPCLCGVARAASIGGD